MQGWQRFHPGNIVHHRIRALLLGKPFYSGQVPPDIVDQHSVKPGDVNALIGCWDPVYLPLIGVSHRDGSYNVINVQRRLEATRKMNGGDNLIIACLIYTGLSYEQETAIGA